MFLTKTTLPFWLLAVLLIVSTSCQEDANLDAEVTASTNANQSDIVVENGLLHFKDQFVWNTTIKEMQEAEDYKVYISALDFKNSLLSHYEDVEESEESLDKLFELGKLPKIQDHLFASLLNDEAMVKIGDVLYKVTDKHTLSIVDEAGSRLKELQEATFLKRRSDVNVFENLDHLADKTIVFKDEEGSELARFQGSSERDWPKPGSTTMKAEVGAWSRTYGLYSSVGVKIETQSLRRGGIFNRRRWRSRISDYLYCFGLTRTQECYPIDGCGAKFLKSGSNSRRGKRCERTLVQAPTGWHVTDWIDGVYKVRFNAGEPTYEMTVSWY